MTTTTSLNVHFYFHLSLISGQAAGYLPEGAIMARLTATDSPALADWFM